MRVLAVDDSRTVRFLIKKILKKVYGDRLEFHEAADGIEGLKATEQFQFDYVFLDVNMPKMNGLELLEKLTAAQYPAIMGFVSSLGVAQNVEKARALGAQFFVDKPLTEAKLTAVMGTEGNSEVTPSQSPTAKACAQGVNQLLDSLLVDLGEAMASSLEAATVEMTGTVKDLAPPFYGATIEIGTGQGQFTVVLSMSAKHCQELTDQILDAVTSSDDFLPDIDAGDALGELMNTIGGMTLKKLFSAEGGVRLSLPKYLEGDVYVGELGETAGYEIRINEIPATLMIAAAAKQAA